ncbi:MAG: NAD(P)/FAD-dependent oxidoreductase, partial [Bacillota bacterium]
LAGASAVEGIRERDPNAPILLVGAEPDLPYNRPPLSKGLWLGKEKVEEIFVHDRPFYAAHHADLTLGAEVVQIDPGNRIVTDKRGNQYHYRNLLLATGGHPRRLAIPGGDLPGILYYRAISDYRHARSEAMRGKSAVVIGAGFIGSEMAAALSSNGIEVTMVFPGSYLAERVFPKDLAKAITERYQAKGVTVVAHDSPTAIQKTDGRFRTQTRSGKTIESDLLIVGIGIEPATTLAQMAGLKIDNGIVVDDRLRTSERHIYAAGDNARFPYEGLNELMRVEHWDNALNGGKWAGRNMAGAEEPYAYMPFFFSDLFEFGYEAVGDVRSNLGTFEDWQKPYDTGVVYYLQEGRVRGAMMCGLFGKVDEARELIRSGRRVTAEDLRGAIR